MSNTSKEDWEFCQQHQKLSDLLVEHGCAPAGEDRGLLRALVARSERLDAAIDDLAVVVYEYPGAIYPPVLDAYQAMVEALEASRKHER